MVMLLRILLLLQQSWKVSRQYVFLFRVSKYISSQDNSSTSTNIRARQIRRKAKTNKTLILVSIFFFLSWAPINIFNSLSDLFQAGKVI